MEVREEEKSRKEESRKNLIGLEYEAVHRMTIRKEKGGIRL